MPNFSHVSPAVPALIEVQGVSLSPIEWQGERVMPLSMVDQLHKRFPGTAKKNFDYQRNRFIEAKHSYTLNSGEAKSLGFTAPRGMILLTERGYLLLATTFQDDLSYEIREILIESYFRVQQAPLAIPDFEDTRTLQTMLLGHMEKVLALQDQVAAQGEQIALQQPAVEFLEAVSASPETFTMNQVAHQLGIGEKKLWGLLRDMGHIQRYNTIPTQKYRLQGLYEVELKTRVDESGWTHSYQLTRVTTKGMIRLRDFFAKTGRQTASQAMLPGI